MLSALLLAGQVLFFVDAKSDFDAWTQNPSDSQKQFMSEHYYRMQTYSPYFDNRLEWYPNAWAYKDAMAIKPAWSVYSEHPDWVLRDSNGNQLYVRWGCSNGTCPQYAADIGNPDFRNWWINGAARLVNQLGYAGIWVDDVNLDWRISNGQGQIVIPVDPRTGKLMTLADWRRYFAEFMEELRAALPDAEIAHNTIWYADYDGFVERQWRAADYINFERGISDGGITQGTGKYGFETFLNAVKKAHSLGRHIILDDDDDAGTKERDYELGFYFLINDGGDLIGADGDRSRMNPDSFWDGYNTNLGAPVGDWYKSGGLFKRDFTCGAVVVNQPPVSTAEIVLLECGDVLPEAPTGLTLD
ncbi:MAG: putative glycoside hydrolase family 15 protein [Gammaproteobacteria bacterium]|nr:putative glycoside hydrolase family 15 protein [Gammaproteobacteria bacterium]